MPDGLFRLPFGGLDCRRITQEGEHTTAPAASRPLSLDSSGLIRHDLTHATVDLAIDALRGVWTDSTSLTIVGAAHRGSPPAGGAA